MPCPKSLNPLFALAAVAGCLALSAAAPRAQDAPTPAQGPVAAGDEEEVVRISSDLVQTDVVVLDKQGRFVEGLKREEFEVAVDGRPQQLLFFESVAAGSREELAAHERARRTSAAPGPGPRPPAPAGRGRAFFFFVDDLHLAPDSLERARRSLRRFIDETLEPGDEAVVASPSGQIGFLQQLTGNKAVLRAAVERLKRGGSPARDLDRPPMTEYLAYLIERRDSDVLAAYVEQMVRETKLDPSVAERLVKARARALLTQSDTTNRNVLLALQSMMRAAAHYPGRKLAYFFSDGFVPNVGGSDFGDMVRRISDAAARAGVVLYSVDARGLSTGGLVDAARADFVDTSGRIARAQMQELSDTQEPLHSLAAATGGRAFVNSNSLDEGLARAVQETTRYYLLAWRPEGADPRDKGFRKLQVKVAGRPDLKVLVRSGFFGTSSPEEEEREARAAKGAKQEKGAAPAAAAATLDELLSALTALSAQRALPVGMSLGYEQARAGGSLLTASIQLDAAALDYGASGAPPQPAEADVACAVYDVAGTSVGTFRQRLQVPPPPGSDPKRATLKNEAPLEPGLYQVRVAARDARSGKVGSAIDWVEVPEFKPGAFSLSSIYLAESAQGAGPGEASVNFHRRFARTSRLGFMVHIYDAARTAPSPPDVTIKVEVLRGKEAALPALEAGVPAGQAPDASRLKYVGDFDLSSLAPGRYVLQLTATDRTSKASVTRQVDFMVL